MKNELKVGQKVTMIHSGEYKEGIITEIDDSDGAYPNNPWIMIETDTGILMKTFNNLINTLVNFSN